VHIANTDFLFSDPGHDLAFYRVPATVKESIKPLKVVSELDSAQIKGMNIILLGYWPTKKSMSLSEGQFDEPTRGPLNSETDVYEYGHDANTTSGCSGSPIFNENGEIVGVHYGFNGISTNRAVPGRVLRELLRRIDNLISTGELKY